MDIVIFAVIVLFATILVLCGKDGRKWIMKRQTTCFEIFLTVLLFTLFQLVFMPFVIMVFVVTSELMNHGWSFSDALNGGLGWPLYILDFVVSTILSG